jgi:hypothetical protein
MFENEDMILPDDFQETVQPETETIEDLPVGEELDTTETEQTEGLTEQQQEAERQAFLRVKYNKEEMELDEHTARELAQKGLNYDKTLERLQALESDPRLSFVEELAREQGMDTNEYLEAVRQHREQQRIDELVQQGISEEVAQEMLENRKFREQFESEKKSKMEEEKKNAEFQEFFGFFRNANGRDFVPGQDEIPQSVWEAHAQGVPLKFAFMEHQMNQLQSQLQVLKQNKVNETKAPIGSVTRHGGNEVASEDDFLSGFNSI